MSNIFSKGIEFINKWAFKPERSSKAGAVNFIWNFCNQTQQFALKHKKKWPSAFDLNNLTAGSSKTLKLHSQTVQAICEQYVQSRKQHKKASLKFRTNKANKSLAWIPFKAKGIQFNDKTGWASYQGVNFRLYYHRPLPVGAKITNGSICQDSQGHWFLNLTFKIQQTALDYYSQAVLIFRQQRSWCKVSVGVTVN